jgi:integrase/recombinase XerD
LNFDDYFVSLSPKNYCLQLHLKPMKATKITLQQELRIRVDFPHDSLKVQQIKTIPDARWSASLKAWHIPYSTEAFNLLKRLFPQVEIEVKADNSHADKGRAGGKAKRTDIPCWGRRR